MSPSNTLRPLSVGEILDGAFALYRRRFATIFPTSAIFFIPVLAVQFLRVPFILASYLANFAGLAAGMAVTWQISEAVLGRTPTIRDGLGRCRERFLPAFGALFVMGIFIGLGSLLFIIPGIVLAIRYFAVFQTSVIEASPHPLKRSATLAEDAWGKIFLVWLLAFLLGFIPGFVLETGWFMQRAGKAEPGVVKQVLTTVLLSLTMPFNASVMTLLYYDQRVRKEGLDVKLAAAEAALAVASPPAPQPRA